MYSAGTDIADVSVTIVISISLRRGISMVEHLRTAPIGSRLRANTASGTDQLHPEPGVLNARKGWLVGWLFDLSPFVHMRVERLRRLGRIPRSFGVYPPPG